MKEKIYLDHAATTPMDPEVIDIMTKALSENYGNASSIHQLGKKNRVLIDYARQTMAESIGAKTNEIIITSGGTESDNTAIIKTAEHLADRGKHIITTNVEHPAVLNPMKYLENKGFEITYLPADTKGKITLEQVKEAIRPDTILISIMYGNNEVGAIMPIQAIGECLKELDQEIIFHTDAVQAYGSIPLDVEALNVDLLSVSAHKMNGPKGIGFLYIREGIKIPSLLLGGAQENEHRAGTENIPAILAFEKAIQIHQKNQTENYNHLMELKKTFIKEMDEADIDYSVNGEINDSLPHVLSLCIPAIRSDMLLIQMDLEGVFLSAGSACSAGTLEPSHVLIAMFGDEATEIDHTLRFSFGVGTTLEEIKKTVELLKKLTLNKQKN